MDAETRKKLQEKYGEDILEIGDEYMASIAEGGIIKPSVWNRIVSNIKSALHKIGINISLTENDIKELLWRSHNRLTGENEHDSQILSELKRVQYVPSRRWKDYQRFGFQEVPCTLGDVCRATSFAPCSSRMRSWWRYRCRKTAFLYNRFRLCDRKTCDRR